MYNFVPLWAVVTIQICSHLKEPTYSCKQAAMLHFTFHLWPPIHTVLSQSQPRYQHVTTHFRDKGRVAASRGFLKNANPHSLQLCWAFPLLVWACAQRWSSLFFSHIPSLYLFSTSWNLLSLEEKSGMHFCFIENENKYSLIIFVRSSIILPLPRYVNM